MKYKLTSCTVLLSLLFFAAGGCSCSAGQLLWPKTEGDYVSHRIPGIVATQKGTLLAYCEARKTTDDWAEIDIQMRRSTDGGKTWSRAVILGSSIPRGTRNNPVMLVDSENKIHMIICYKYGIPEGGGKVFYLCSEDDGVTWSEPADITEQTESEEVQHAQFACGPSHGIELQDGTLLFPFWFVKKEDFTNTLNNSPCHISTLYSADGGTSWQVGEIAAQEGDLADPSEPCVAQLSTGEVMINVRVGGTETSLRGITVSPNGRSGWSPIRYEPQLQDPGCEGSLVRYDENTLLFANCNSARKSEEKDRMNLTLRFSRDDGATWSQGTVVCKSDSMYSDIAVYGEKIYIIYEEGYYDGLSIRLKEYQLSDIK